MNISNFGLGKWVGRGLLIGAVWAALDLAPLIFLCAFVLALAALVGFHVALFRFSKPIFEWVLRHEVDYFDISKGGDLYLRRFYLTPRLHLPEWFLGRLPKRLASVLRKRLFLHWIVRSDDDRDPHCHPWAFISYVLAGFGLEKIWFPKTDLALVQAVNLQRLDLYPIANQRAWGRQYFPGRVVANPAEHTHMLQVVEPLWTLVVADERQREWGFWVIDPTDPSKDVWIDQETYKDRGDESRPEEM